MKKRKIHPSLLLVIALLLGILCGAVFGQKMVILEPIGTAFIRLIKMLLIPVVMCSIISSVAGMVDIGKLKRIGGKMMAIYLLNTAMAAAIGLGIGNLVKPGLGITIDDASNITAPAEWSLSVAVERIVPENIFGSMASATTLHCILFSIMFGVALIMIGDKAKPVTTVLDACTDALYKMIGMIMKLAPIGCFCLIASNIGKYGMEVFSALGKYLACAYTADIFISIIYCVMACILGGISLKRFIKSGFKIFSTAFTTRSSNAALPVNIQVCKDELDVPDEIASFVLPIGATINMAGMAMGLALKATLASYIFGKPVSLMDCVIVIAICTISGIGCAGIPNGGTMFWILMFETLGFPTNALIAMLQGVANLEDMISTAVNVLGDSCTAIIVSNSERKRKEKYGKIAA